MLVLRHICIRLLLLLPRLLLALDFSQLFRRQPLLCHASPTASAGRRSAVRRRHTVCLQWLGPTGRRHTGAAARPGRVQIPLGQLQFRLLTLQQSRAKQLLM